MKPEIQKQLHKIITKYKNYNFDELRANPLNLMTYENTVLFLSKLPNDIPSPELVVETNGDLNMVWRNGKSSLQVTCKEFKESIPESIIEHIRNLMKK
jgi:hypothetical protein